MSVQSDFRAGNTNRKAGLWSIVRLGPGFQVYSSQIYHERVRKEYVEYAAKRYEMFEAFVDDERKWAERLHNLKIHMAVCGNLEIQVVSQLYK